MNHITNELGQVVPAVGQEGSAAWVKANYAITLPLCILSLVRNKPLDMPIPDRVWQAARFYIDNPGCYLPDEIPTV